MPKDSEELQPWNHTTLTVSNPKLNFLLCRMLLVEMETGRAGEGEAMRGEEEKWRGAFFESLNLYGLLQYQALRTRSDADTFVEGWQISCPSRCLIAWPLFTKWWWWWGGGRRRGEEGRLGCDSGKWCPCQWGGPCRKCTLHPVY